MLKEQNLASILEHSKAVFDAELDKLKGYMKQQLKLTQLPHPDSAKHDQSP